MKLQITINAPELVEAINNLAKAIAAASSRPEVSPAKPEAAMTEDAAPKRKERVMVNAIKRWNEADDRFLLESRKRGIKYSAIAKGLNCSESACRGRVRALNNR